MRKIRHPIESIRLIAIDNCLAASDFDWYIEKAYRHYSKTYHTPLHFVKELLIPEAALQIMMEDEMSTMAIEELEDLRQTIADDHTGRPFLDPAMPAPSENDEQSDDEWIAEQNRLLKEQESQALKKKTMTENLQKVTKSVEQATEKISESLKHLMGLRSQSIDDLQNIEGSVIFPPETES